MAARNETYVRSASYAPCPACNEGSLAWDATLKTSRCTACREVS